MTRDVFDLFEQALQQPAERREAWIDAACAGDTALAEEVRGLLRADARTAGMLDRSHGAVLDAAGLRDAGAAERRIGERVGPYRLTALLGSGGMGVVYRAARDDGSYAQDVALKLMRHGALDAGARARFELERRILARLVHAHIARLTDAGIADDGTPWFAMEYVPGEPIPRWCDARTLDIEARLRLFLDVLGAVEYAHSHSVVHRDIKPGNVLVDAQGNAKLLDFGIAKLIAEDAPDAPPSLTATQARLLTPQYAAPEQIRGEAATTATDIHALGLLLHELLCGMRAFGGGGRSTFEVQRDILEAQPPSMAAQLAADEAQAATIAADRQLDPRALKRSLQGDLQLVVAKALRKEPQERYRTVVQFADDVRRYLAAEPLLAAAGARGYRLRKFVQRHRTGVALGTIAVAAIVAGTAGIAWQAHRAAQEAAHAEREARLASASRDFLLSLFKSADVGEAVSKKPSAKDLVDAGTRRLDTELADQPELRTQLLDAIGNVYFDLGEYPAATQTLRHALAVAKGLFGAESEKTQDIAVHLASVIATSHRAEDLDEALKLIDPIVAQQQALPVQQRNLVVDALNARAAIRSEQPDGFGDALNDAQQAVAVARERHAASEKELVPALVVYGNTLIAANRAAEALPLLREALAIRESKPESRGLPAAEVRNMLAAALIRTGGLAEAETLMRQVLAIQRELLGEASPSYARSLRTLAEALTKLGKLDEAETALRQSLPIARDQFGANSTDVLMTLNDLAIVNQSQRDFPAARDYFEQAQTLFQAQLGEDDVRTLTVSTNLASTDLAMGDFVQADALFRDLLARYRRVNPQGAFFPMQMLAVSERTLGRPQEAFVLNVEALDLAEKSLGRDSDFHRTIRLSHALDQRDLGRYDDARKAAEALRADLPASPPPPLLSEVRYLLAELDVLQHRCVTSADAVPALEAALERQQHTVNVPVAKARKVAEAGLMLGLCRRQANPGDAGAKALIADNANVLLASPIAEPFLKNLAAGASRKP